MHMSGFDDFEICRGILESLPVGLCVVDLQKKIVLWSDGAERLTGHLRHEVLGHSCIAEALLHCDQPGCEFCGEECPLARAMKSAQPAEAAGFLHHKKGHEIPVRLRAVPIHNGHGSIIGAVETFEDCQFADPGECDHQLKMPSCVDEVTGLPNHAMMQSRLRETLGTFHEVEVPFGVLCFRIEGLEHFRAALGPEAASALLRVMGRTLECALWKSDFVGRWSDDQFLVILNGCREHALGSVGERLRRMLANDSIEWWGERRSLRASVAQVTAQQGDTLELLLDRLQKSIEAAAGGGSRAASTSFGS